MDRDNFIKKMETTKAKTEEEKNEIVHKGIENSGDVNLKGERNLIIVMEELAELTQCVSKYLRDKGDEVNMLEEIADVLIGIDTLCDICNIEKDEIEKAIAVKLDRLKNKLNEEGKWN